MKALSAYKQIYFVGIGGIGMSALARYFHVLGLKVLGYDKTESPLTKKLEEEGLSVHYSDLGLEVAQLVGGAEAAENTLVVYTPAIKQLEELAYFKSEGFEIVKRAEVLGLITQNSKGLGVAGTHGKTTTSTMLSHILNESIGCSAFLGGISSNFESNYLLNTNAEYTVVEADEFDRSFLKLHPFASIVTSCDADHLDIYGDYETFKSGFQDYVNLVSDQGFLVLRKGLDLVTKGLCFSYAVNEEADFSADNLRYVDGSFTMDVAFEEEKWTDVVLGLPGLHNAENALACIAVCVNIGLSEAEIRAGLRTFKGVKRRFEYHVKQASTVYIDDYAHHPKEIKALLSAVRLMYPSWKMTVLFQPHLFSRTRDFEDDFARELSEADELILLPIYPAREEPIEHVTSEALAAKCTNNVKVIPASEVLAYVEKQVSSGVILSVGAGDIDRLVPALKTLLEK